MTTDASNTYDLLVIGGGINGAGVARDAAGRGFSVCLCEANDLAAGTSSASSKLIHGGLRYLEYYEFGLVRKALQEREVLLGIAPHIIRPMRFILPHSNKLRSWWLLRAGLFLYDHLGHRKILRGTRDINFSRDPAGTSLKPEFQKGFEYSDCWVDDARLVVLNAVDAARNGAEIKVRTKVEKVTRENGIWQVTTKNTDSGKVEKVFANVVVNAAGPWVDNILGSAFNRGPVQNVRHVRGSHIVVPKLFDHDKAYIFQNPDGRIIFAIPYEEDFTLIGTTDVDHGDDLGAIEINQEEAEYLCNCASNYFEYDVSTEDIVWSYSGVRPLYDDGADAAQEATRDYVIETETEEQSLLINIFGGKITTYRRLSETILEHVEKFLGKRGNSWTAHSALPGGDFELDGASEIENQLHSRLPFLDDRTIVRLVRLYGTRALDILKDVAVIDDLGIDFGNGLYQVEVEYLVQNEWACTAEDILFRRTKLGITMPQVKVNNLERYLQESAKICTANTTGTKPLLSDQAEVRRSV